MKIDLSGNRVDQIHSCPEKRLSYPLPMDLGSASPVSILFRANQSLLDTFQPAKHHCAMSELNQLLQDIEQAESSSLARKDWRPRHSGVIDIRIASDGTWYHEGRAIQRESLTRLFASVLRKQDDEYFLLTPAEKLSIRVDDAPFVATMLEIFNEAGQQALVFTTNLGEKIVADSAHPIRVEIDEAAKEPRPYIHFRDGLEALISRTAFFDLANASEISHRDGRRHLTISSMGVQFDLGCADE